MSGRQSLALLAREVRSVARPQGGYEISGTVTEVSPGRCVVRGLSRPCQDRRVRQFSPRGRRQACGSGQSRTRSACRMPGRRRGAGCNRRKGVAIRSIQAVP